MSRRREANRAEAILRGIGAIIMLLLLLVMVNAMPQVMKGKNPQEMINAVLGLITWFALLGGAITVIGLVVWVMVMRGTNRRSGNVRGGGGTNTILCPECGNPMVLKKSRFGRFWGCSAYPACTGKRQFSSR